MFDLIVGTSAGAITAAALGMGKDCSACETLYKLIVRKAFSVLQVCSMALARMFWIELQIILLPQECRDSDVYFLHLHFLYASLCVCLCVD